MTKRLVIEGVEDDEAVELAEAIGEQFAVLVDVEDE